MSDATKRPDRPEPRWKAALRLYRDRRMILLFFLGFSSGLPLLLSYGTLQFWLLKEGLDIKAVGLFAAATTPYGIKFLWAPVLDRTPLPLLTRALGQRRAWMLVTQAAVAVSIFLLALSNPTADPWDTAALAVALATASASQDIVIDAWRVDILDDDEQGAGGFMAVIGYRVGMLVAGAGALYTFAGVDSWPITYMVMSLCMLVGILATLLAPEPPRQESPLRQANESAAQVVKRNFVEGVVGPFRDLMGRRGWVLFFLFIVLFKFGDAMAGVMTNPLLVKLEFTPTEIANIGKVYGFTAVLIGGALGGFLSKAIGLVPTLWIAGVLQMLSNLMFVAQAHVGHDVWMLAATVGFENLSGGVGNTVFVAYLSALCSKSYSATQYALLSALSGLLKKGAAAASGYIVAGVGYADYFVLTTFAALPGLVLLYFLQRWRMTGLHDVETDN